MAIANAVSINTTTGVLTTATDAPLPASYLTVVASNAHGSDTETISVEVVADAVPVLINDTQARSPSPLSLPAYLASFADPDFGPTITRVSGDVGNAIGALGATWRSPARHHYNSDSAWNADESLIYLTSGSSTGKLFLNGADYTPVYLRSRSYSDTRWHPVISNEMVYISGNTMTLWDVVADGVSTIRTFAGYSGLQFGQYEGVASNDGDVWALTGTRTSDGDFVVITYKISTDTILSVISVTDLGKTMSDGRATISPDGDYIAMLFDDQTGAIYEVNGKLVYNITATQSPSHHDVIKWNGTQYLVGPTRGNADGSGHIIRRQFASNSVTKINAHSYAYHVSARNYLNPEWVLASYFQDSYQPYAGELVAVRMDGTASYRICHHRCTGESNYTHESHGCLSPTGKRAIFASDWGTGPSGNVHCFVADFRGFDLPAV